MAQENNLELIDYLTDELAKECEKQRMTFALAIGIDDETILASSAGHSIQLFACIDTLHEHFEDETGMSFDRLKKTMNEECDCPICKARRNKSKTKNIGDDVLAKFLAALFEVEKEGDTNVRY